MRAILKTAIFAATTIVSTTAWALQPDAAPVLATDPTWLKLGHYERVDTSAKPWRSTVHSEDFFLSPNGATDPAAELSATLTKFNESPGGNPDQHAQCRFPARLMWVKKRLGDHYIAQNIDCPEFRKWTRDDSISSVSVILATGFLGNPASYYGHTLLKFNFSDGSTSNLLDESASFGAIDEGETDNPVLYIIKSLTGGYDAGFSHIQFYFHDHHYGDGELRDIWEYRLDLDPFDRNFIVAHTWELLGQRYTYGFFRGNCALRMAEVIEIIGDISIAPRNRPWVIPQALITQLTTVKYRERPLVGQIIYHPSRQSRFYSRYSGLDSAGHDLLDDLVRQRTTLEDETFGSLTVEAQQEVLDTLLDYYQFAYNPLEGADGAIKVKYGEALAKRFSLPPGSTEQGEHTASPPHLGHAPGWLQFGWSHSGQGADAISIRFRGAYYDALDFDDSQVRFGTLAMGDVQIEILDDSVRLDHLDIVRVESINPGMTGLPGDRGKAWKLGIGMHQVRQSCEKCLVVRLDGDRGYTQTFLNQTLLFGIHAGGALQTEAAGQGWGFGKLSASLQMKIGTAFRANLAYERRQPIGGGHGAYGVTRLTLRMPAPGQTDFRVQFADDGIAKIGFGLGVYW